MPPSFGFLMSRSSFEWVSVLKHLPEGCVLAVHRRIRGRKALCTQIHWAGCRLRNDASECQTFLVVKMNTILLLARIASKSSFQRDVR